MRRGWINDPNGLVHYDGVYHLFCQHYPNDVRWGPMHWSHATSTDLVNWKERPIALYPDELGTCFSGSAVVDRQNTSGLGKDGIPPILAFYTAAGNCVTPEKKSTQCMAFSTDKGKTWRKYKHNPVLDHVIGGNRDPKVSWHGPMKRWIMVLYLDVHTFGLFGSLDARHWEELSRFAVEGNCECPDLFEIPVAGKPHHRKWVFMSGAGHWPEGDCARYVIGSFDGIAFTPESNPVPIDEGGWNYSTQTWSDAPGGRRIFIGWFSTMFDGTTAFPGNPFNGQYRIPWELTLVETESGPRLARLPVEETKTLRIDAVEYAGKYAPGIHSLEDIDTRSFEIDCAVDPGKASAVGFRFEGVDAIGYDIASGTMRVMDRRHPWPLEPDGKLVLRVFFDVNCIEMFGPQGLKVMSCIYPLEALNQLDETQPRLAVEARGAAVTVERMTVYPLRSIWR
jgi:fructan beta-fructosidase